MVSSENPFAALIASTETCIHAKNLESIITMS
jgi:hypothetical protein